MRKALKWIIVVAILALVGGLTRAAPLPSNSLRHIPPQVVTVGAQNANFSGLASYTTAANNTRYVAATAASPVSKLVTAAKSAVKNPTPVGLAFMAAFTAAGYFLDESGTLLETTGGEYIVEGEYAPVQSGESSGPWEITPGTYWSWTSQPSITRNHVADVVRHAKDHADAGPCAGSHYCVVQRLEWAGNDDVTVRIRRYNSSDIHQGDHTYSWTLEGTPTGDPYTPSGSNIAVSDEDLGLALTNYAATQSSDAAKQNMASWFYNDDGTINHGLVTEVNGPDLDASTQDQLAWYQAGTHQTTDPQGANYIAPEDLPYIQQLAADANAAVDPAAAADQLNQLMQGDLTPEAMKQAVYEATKQALEETNAEQEAEAEEESVPGAWPQVGTVAEAVQAFMDGLEGTPLIGGLMGVFSIQAGAGSCPAFSIDIYGGIGTTVHCDVMTIIAPVLSTLMMFAWVALGAVKVLEA